MAKRSAQDYGSSRPSLTAEMIEGDTIVLTIRETEEVAIPDGDGERKSLVIRFEEFPEHSYWTNKGIVQTVIDLFGDDDEDWKGQSIALEKVKVRNPRDNKTVVKLYPVETAEQAAVLKEWRAATKKGSGRKTAATKRSR